MSPQLWLFRKIDFSRISLFATDNMQGNGFIADNRKSFLSFAFDGPQILYLGLRVVKIKLFAHLQIIPCNKRSIILRLSFEIDSIFLHYGQSKQSYVFNVISSYYYCSWIINTSIDMQLEEFTFIYEDMKAELKEIPSLPLLLKSIEKTTKKLDCMNLYSLIDRREFDLELYQKEIYTEITQLVYQVSQISQVINQQSLDEDRIAQLQHKIQQIKQSKMEAFDKLNKQEEYLQEQLARLIDEQMFVKPINVEDEIKEVAEDEEEMPEEVGIGQQNRIASLKKEIDEINMKILRINRGKGKWFDGDHNDFVKLYNRCGGDGQKVIEQGIKILGMKNIQIMDHLQVYETYLQLQKQKKIVTQEFKSIKMFEQELKNQEDIKQQISNQEKEKIRKKQKEEENIVKKMHVEQFKRKKAEQREKLAQQLMKEKDEEKKTKKLSLEKINDIRSRNKRLIQQRQEQFKIKANISGYDSKTNQKLSINLVIPNQVHTLKQITKFPKLSIFSNK